MAVPLQRSNLLMIVMVLLGLSLQSALVWTVAYFHYGAAPQIAVFDADKGVERFVVWSSDRVSDEQFDAALAKFGADVEVKLDVWSRATGVAVVRYGAVISSGSSNVVDWTDEVVREVLQ